MNRIVTMVVLAAALAGCGGKSDSGDSGGNNSSGTETVPQQAPPPGPATGESNATVPIPQAQPSPLATLPPEFHARWGQAQNDCAGGPAAQAGLLILTGDALTSSAGRARITHVTLVAPDTVKLDLSDANGTRTDILTLTDGNKTLTRKGAGQALTYSKCP